MRGVTLDSSKLKFIVEDVTLTPKVKGEPQLRITSADRNWELKI